MAHLLKSALAPNFFNYWEGVTLLWNSSTCGFAPFILEGVPISHQSVRGQLSKEQPFNSERLFPALQLHSDFKPRLLAQSTVTSYTLCSERRQTQESTPPWVAKQWKSHAATEPWPDQGTPGLICSEYDFCLVNFIINIIYLETEMLKTQSQMIKSWILDHFETC